MRPNTVNGMYDYRFGWRWLLPFEPGPDIYLAGFDENERAFWSEALATDARVDTAGPAKGWIINAGPASAQPPVIPAMDASTQWVAVVASDKCMGQWRRNIADNFSSIREYAMLPAFNPRVVIPLGSPRHTYYALNLHRPGRPAARAGLKAAQLLALMGNYAFLKKRLLIATRNPSACPAGAMQSDILGHVSGTPLDYALYLGTPGENRKTTVLPLNSKKPHTILKIAATQQARSSLMNEAAALKELRTTPLAQNLPLFDGLVENKDTLTLYQEYRIRQRAGRVKMNAEVIKFLGGLSTINRQVQPLSNLLKGLVPPAFAQQQAVCLPAFRGLLQYLETSTRLCMPVFLHRTHGDFAPWNSAWTRQGFFVFDWEESRKEGLAFGDAFYYVTAPALLVQRRPDPGKTIAAALRLAGRVARAGGFESINLNTYLALWLLQRSYKAPLYEKMLQEFVENWL